MSLPKFLQSSDGSGDLSARANSLLVGLLPVLVLVLPMFGVNLNPESGKEGVELLVKFIAGAEALLAVGWQIKGWAERNLRKRNGLGVFAK